MADITLTYTPANGAVFSPTGWSTDIWSTVNGQSVQGEINGHIERVNFATGTTLKPRHIRPFETFRAESDGAMETLDVIDRIFGENYDVNGFLPVPGTAVRVYVPWAGPVIYNVSAFVTQLRMREGPASGQSAVITGPSQTIALAKDGQIESATLRNLPYTYYPQNNPGDAEYIYSREQVLTHHFDFSWIDLNEGPGYHEITMVVQSPINRGTEEMFPLYDTDPAALCTHEVMHRVRFGIRAAQIICLAGVPDIP